MAQNARIGDQRIEPPKRIQIAAAESHDAGLEKNLTLGEHGLRNILDRGLRAFMEYEEAVCVNSQHAS